MFCESFKRLTAFGLDGEGHAFLRFGDEYFPRLEAFVFERRTGEFTLAAAGIFAHLAERAGDAACPVVGNAAEQAEVAGLKNELVQFALGQRVADLHRLRRRFGAQLFGREGGPVDAVLSDAAAAHDRPVAHFNLFAFGGAAGDLHRNGAHRAAVDQRLAEVAFVKALEAAAVRDTRLVAAVDHAFMYAVANAARVHQTFRNLPIVKRRSETVAPDIRNERRAHAGAERVAVDSDDAGHRTAVGIERGRRVVGFHLVDEMDIFIEFHDAGVVGKDRNKPVDRFGNLVGGGFDVGFVERVNDLLFAGFLVLVVDGSGKNLVRAVLAPGLGDAFELDVGRPFGQTQFSAVSFNIVA